MPSLTFILGDQLFPEPAGPPPYFMREDLGMATNVRHHKQKLVLFFSAMRHYARELQAPVTYQKLGECAEEYGEALAQHCHRSGVNRVIAYEPNDAAFAPTLDVSLATRGIQIEWLPSPAFLTTTAQWESFAAGRKHLRMADFYAEQRRRTGLLMEDGQPVGGRWSFDSENRAPWPKGKTAPAWPTFAPDAITNDVIQMVEKRFVEHPGRPQPFGWPVTRAEALVALRRFCSERLHDFGRYEDAISKDQDVLFHSTLSPSLNIGLLTPRECLNAALATDAPLPSVEGFVRQILGWREFVRRMDGSYDEAMPNALEHDRRLGSAWWDGTTGLPPIDKAIRQVLDMGWCHHIERLMVLGAPMLMSEVHPDEAYRWFMEMFVDSAPWVMRPNVYGMSQFADGGRLATKPYLCGSAYIRKMSDYPAGPWCEVWDGLYWRFVSRHRPLLSANPRTAQTVRAYDRLDPERRDRIVRLAEEFVERTTSPGALI